MVKGSLFYGFPPTSNLRAIFEHLKIPVYRKMFFSPHPAFAATIYLFAVKN
jgi:hypothetical protein